MIIEAFGPTWDKGYGKYMPQNLGTHTDEYLSSGLPPGLDVQLRGVGDAELQVSMNETNLSLQVLFPDQNYSLLFFVAAGLPCPCCRRVKKYG